MNIFFLLFFIFGENNCYYKQMFYLKQKKYNPLNKLMIYEINRKFVFNLMTIKTNRFMIIETNNVLDN